MTPHRLSPATLVVGAALGLGLTLTTLAGGATPAAAQTLDVITLDGDIAVTINRNGETGEQTLMAGDQELLRAPTIVADLVMTDLSGNAAGIVLYADTGDPACAAAPHALTLQFGVPWVQGPLGEPCLPYAAAAYPGGAILFSTADLYRDGDALLFDLEQGAYRLGTLRYAPQPARGWDALDAEVGGYSDLSTLDLYAAEPVYAALASGWGDQLFVFARHLATRTVPIIEGNLLLQTGCLPGQCAFAIGMLAVDPGRETVYAAFLNEGAPDARPALEDWSDEARAVYDRWREGGYR